MLCKASQDELSNQPGVGVGNAEVIVPSKASEVPSPPKEVAGIVGVILFVNIRACSSYLILFIGLPHPSVVVDVLKAIPAVLRRHDDLQLLRSVGSIPKLIVGRLRVSTQLWRSMDPWDGHTTPVVDSPRLRNEGVVLPVVAVKRVSLSQPRFSPLDRDVDRHVIRCYLCSAVREFRLVVAACEV